MGHNVVEDAEEAGQCLAEDSSSMEDEEEEEEQLCTRLEQCTTSGEYLSVSCSAKELILEPTTLVEVSNSVEIDTEFRVDARPERRQIGSPELTLDTETDCDELIEIELKSEHGTEDEEEDWSGDKRRIRRVEPSTDLEEEITAMYVEGPSFRLSAHEAADEQTLAQQNHQFRQQEHNQHQFSEAPTKIGFASSRMKDYFESFRGSRRGEKRRLYRFFKSTRTELVACLLFSLISSQALIVSRSGSLQVSPASTSNLSHDLMVQHQTSNGLPMQLAQGLAMAFTVASLTQVFGHVSGCHLLPSISLALYVKGHIGKGRLASYLVAQSAGSGLGIILLSLLHSSQISLDEYWHTLRSAQLNYSGPEAASGRGRRRKRDAASSAVAGTPPEPDSSSDTNGGGSETILLSIMEQQLHSKLLRRSHPPPPSLAPSGPFLGTPETSISNKSTYHLQESGEQERKTSSFFTEQLAPTVTATGASPATMQHSAASAAMVSSISTLNASTVSSTTSPPIADSTNRPFETSESPNDRSRVPAASSAPSGSPSVLPASEARPTTTATRRRNKRKRQTQTSTATPADQLPLSSHKLALLDQEPASSVLQAAWLTDQPSGYPADTTTSVHNLRAPAAGHYINLLELSLPSAIMSSESIRTCINKQVQISLHQQQWPTVMKNETSLATRGFRHCLALSNSSQMFVFQFLATLLVVLAYLVNVDPRRVDLGFKSLSIGMAYFVACLLTIHSGGFYGNPFQLLFLSWLSPGTEWQGEWFVYLVSPLIGGLFGAVSHEYIDFTSPRNRNKQLHLRRSFYSLDNLPGTDQPQLQQLPVLLEQTPAPGSQCQQQQQQLRGCIQQESHRQQMDSSTEMPVSATILEVSSAASGSQLVAAVRRCRKTSSNSSLDSSGQAGSSSSVVNLSRGSTLATNLQHQMMPTSSNQQQSRGLTTGNNRKLDDCSRTNSYSRRLKLEHQQQLQLADRQRKMNQSSSPTQTLNGPNNELLKQSQRTSLRRSDFDSNFLISSSGNSRGPNTSPIANPRQHQLVNGSVGWM